MSTNFETEKMDKLEKVKNPLDMKGDGFAKDFTKNVKAYSADAAEAISEGYGSALSWVRKNPLQAAAIGAGIGFVLGAVVRRYGERE